jgi:hypothetical protein
VEAEALPSGIRRARVSLQAVVPRPQTRLTQKPSADAYSPKIFPKISFMSGEGGTGGHAGASKGKEWLQMRLFEVEGGDRA